ncbi:MAG: alpha/beta fold hydrolase [Gammaproteobacteria bacterium]|nr:MAG: alpha/beta fold hydrolase [Gammaproteobacteria bacterium]
MPVVEANGIHVHYQLGGQGEHVLFISGTGGDLRNRPNVFDGPLAKAFEVLTYDQRGLGQTEKPDTEYCMADYADDAAGMLDAVGWDRVRVMGVSFGGMVAQELALRFPDRVSSLVLACTSSGGEGGASYPLHELEQLDETARIERNLELADTRRDPAWRESHPEKWQSYVEISRAARRADRDPVGASKQLAARAGHDTWDRLPHLAVPVFLAGGRYDGIAPVANMEALAARIPGAALRLYEGGHLFLIQDKSAYPHIIQWLRENG